MAVRQTLRECRVFSALISTELEKVASLAVEKQYEAGATIFRLKDHAEEFLVIKEGKVALQTELQVAPPQMHKMVTVDVVNKNEALGWSAIVEPYSYTLTAVCLQRTTVIAINGTRLRALIQNDCHLGHSILSGLIKVVASRLSETIHVLVSERVFTPGLA